MSTLAIAAVGTVTGVIGAAAMYIPARLARYDARSYVALAEEKLTECEARDAAYEQARTLQPFWSFDAPELTAAPEHEGEVLHVEHATGELPIVAEPCCELYSDELFNPASCPVPACGAFPDPQPAALSDRPAEDDDEVGEEQPGESWFDGLVRVWHRLLDAMHRAATGPVLPLWLVRWWQSLGASRRERHMVGSGEQATDRDPFAELLAHVEQQPVTIVHRDHRYRDPGMTGQYPLVKVVGDKAAGRHRAEVPAQRSGDADA